MSDEEKVKAKWPGALCLRTPSWYPLSYRIYPPFKKKRPKHVGEGVNRDEAWSDAARRIEEGENG